MHALEILSLSPYPRAISLRNTCDMIHSRCHEPSLLLAEKPCEECHETDLDTCHQKRKENQKNYRHSDNFEHQNKDESTKGDSNKQAT